MSASAERSGRGGAGSSTRRPGALHKAVAIGAIPPPAPIESVLMYFVRIGGYVESYLFAPMLGGRPMSKTHSFGRCGSGIRHTIFERVRTPFRWASTTATVAVVLFA